MPQPIKSNKHGDQNAKQTHDSDAASNNLWVGNLANDVKESDLAKLFGKFGELDTITSYASRSYAFLYFKRTEDAVLAKNSLQGTVFHGNSMKIEFAKPAKPCKSLWVSGINPSVSKEKLEGEFAKFGEIEDFKFLRDRNAALVDYFKLEDASQALKIMNGKRIGGDQIRVDFLRSQSSRREHWPDVRDVREGQFFIRNMGPPDSPWMPQEFIKNYAEPTHLGLRRQQHSQFLGGRKGDGPPSNVLWIAYPPTVHIDEQMLHNAMILFGEIESIRSFPSKHHSFVEFRSVDEARRAKEGLEGRLFNDPRILISYLSSELAPTKDFLEIYPATIGPRGDMLLNEHPFRPAHLDMFTRNRPLISNGISGALPPSGMLGPNMPSRPLGPRGGVDLFTSGPDYNDLAAVHKFSDNKVTNSTGSRKWRKTSPSERGILPSPLPGMKPPIRPTSGAWDVFDASQIQRETKRSRIDGHLPYESSRPLKKLDDRGLGLDEFPVLGPKVDEDASASLSAVQGRNRLSPVDGRFTAGGTGEALLDHDYIWRGVIAKGGTTVCRARCVPIGEWIESDIPEVVNCYARTGLDMLTKHYVDAVGFNIVFFLPDSEDDFASYTEFLRYLGAKRRAGVSKFDDGTTLFLVPPSDFLTKVLHVTGPERLYGVVLKFPQHAPSSPSGQSQSHFQSSESQYIDRQPIPPPQTEYRMTPQEERIPQADYNRNLYRNTMTPSKQLVSHNSDSAPVPPLTSMNTATASQAGITLTPELIASLASLLPVKENSTGLESTQQPLASSSQSSLPPNVAADKVALPHGYDNQALEQTGHSLQHYTQYIPQEQLPQLQTYPSVSTRPSHSAQGVGGSLHVQDPVSNLPQQAIASSRTSTNFSYSSQSGQYAVSPQGNQHYQYDIPQNTQTGYDMAYRMDGFGSDGSSVYRPGNPVTVSNQDIPTQANTTLPVSTEKVNPEFSNQFQQIHHGLSGADKGSSEIEVDKNQRYQSTLQFAANLLLQIQQQQQQQQQQTSGQAVQGHGSR